MKLVRGILVVLLSLGVGTMCGRAMADGEAPAWANRSTPVKTSEIPKSDYPYLADWLDQHAKPPQEYVIDLFKQHDLVIFGEGHNIKEHKEFLIGLIPQLYHKAGVRCIAWEFSRQADNDLLEKLVTAPEYDRAAALGFARDQLSHAWDSKEHWDVIEAVWRLNKSLKPDETRMRLTGISPNVDWCEFFITAKTNPPESTEYRQIVLALAKKVDAIYAQPIEEEILAKGIKGLAYVGRAHDWTHYEFSNNGSVGGLNLDRPIMGSILYKKYGERVFQVCLGFGFYHPIEEVMALRGHQPVGFDLFASPFANILTPAGWDAPEVPLSRVARGYVYLGPSANLHTNTPIKGFVTEDMFKKYQRYYEIDFGHKFANAEEVDQYLAKHAFPSVR